MVLVALKLQADSGACFSLTCPVTCPATAQGFVATISTMARAWRGARKANTRPRSSRRGLVRFWRATTPWKSLSFCFCPCRYRQSRNAKKSLAKAKEIDGFFDPPLCPSAGGAHSSTDPQVLHLPVPGHGEHRQEKIGRHGVHGGRGGPKRHLRPEKARILQKQRHHLLHGQRRPAVHRRQQLAAARTEG